MVGNKGNFMLRVKNVETISYLLHLCNIEIAQISSKTEMDLGTSSTGTACTSPTITFCETSYGVCLDPHDTICDSLIEQDEILVIPEYE